MMFAVYGSYHFPILWILIGSFLGSLCADHHPLNGHMKPLGWHIKPDTVDEYQLADMISPQTFASDYVIPRKPVVLRNVAQSWPAYSRWTDEYLSTIYANLELRLESKKEYLHRIPEGDICLGRGTMKHFTENYKNDTANLYVVSELPTPMWSEVYVPPPLACGEFLDKFVEIDLWMNSDVGKQHGGGQSLLHKDMYNTMNCIIRGRKEWKLIELQYNDLVYQSWEPPHDRNWGGFSLINPQKVDLEKFPRVAEIPRWQFAELTAGDCLYLPSQMWHQVNSYGEENKAVAFLFDMFQDRVSINLPDCSNTEKYRKLSDVDVALQYPGTGLMTMGLPLLEDIYALFPKLTEQDGFMTFESVLNLVKSNHWHDDNEDMIRQKATNLHTRLKEYTGCTSDQNCTYEKLQQITRPQIRSILNDVYFTEPSNTYEHEYYNIDCTDIESMLLSLIDDTVLELDKFVAGYIKLGGTRKFALKFWHVLHGRTGTVRSITGKNLLKGLNNIEKACKPYKWYVKGGYDTDEEDHDAVVTPQGFKTQPKREIGGYENAASRDETSNCNEDDGDCKLERRNKIEL